jgi:hypothetical protein
MLEGGWKRKERGERERVTRYLLRVEDVGSVLGICDKALLDECVGRRQESVCTEKDGRVRLHCAPTRRAVTAVAIDEI